MLSILEKQSKTYSDPPLANGVPIFLSVPKWPKLLKNRISCLHFFILHLATL